MNRDVRVLIGYSVAVAAVAVALTRTHAMAALDSLATDVRVLQRTTEHWVAEADAKRRPVEPS